MKPEGTQPVEAPLMPFNEALKKVWSAPPMPKVKPKAKRTKSQPKA